MSRALTSCMQSAGQRQSAISPLLRQPGQIWVYDFSKRLEQPSNDALLPYLDYAFFSYDKDDDYIREFMRRTKAKGAGCVIAMLGEHGSLAYDGQRFYHQAAENVPVVNTVGAGDSYIAEHSPTA
ncbi:MAG: PfkB family carbohydrate kinase [Faecalibacterium prausnitzii]